MLARNPDGWPESWRKLLGEKGWPRKAWARALRAAGATHVCATLAEVAALLEVPRPARTAE